MSYYLIMQYDVNCSLGILRARFWQDKHILCLVSKLFNLEGDRIMIGARNLNTLVTERKMIKIQSEVRVGCGKGQLINHNIWTYFSGMTWVFQGRRLESLACGRWTSFLWIYQFSAASRRPVKSLCPYATTLTCLSSFVPLLTKFSFVKICSHHKFMKWYAIARPNINYLL